MKTYNRGAIEVRQNFSREAIRGISAALREVLADVFAVFVKTRGFHWHLRRHNHLEGQPVLVDQAGELSVVVDEVAERVRTLFGKAPRLSSNKESPTPLPIRDRTEFPPQELLAELCADNAAFLNSLRTAHQICGHYGDIGTATMIETWIAQAEKRIGLLSETIGQGSKRLTTL